MLKIIKATFNNITCEWLRLRHEVSFGEGCIVRGMPRLMTLSETHITVGRHVLLNSKPAGYHNGMPFPVTMLTDRKGAEIIIGDESRLHGCCVHACKRVVVGRRCLMSAGAQIIDSNGHPAELEYAKLRTLLADEPNPVVIGDYCWICSGAIILKGAILGEGCIVAANSVVTSGEYPPYSLLSGIPAKVIRSVNPASALPENYAVDALNMTKSQVM